MNLAVQPTTGLYAGPPGETKLEAESVGTRFRSVTTASNRIKVTHDFHPTALTPNLYQVDVTMENIGGSSIGDLRYRRVMDWDIAPFAFSEYSNFGFVSKYQKGATVPTGQAEFQFKAGSLNFHSENYQWLVVAGAKAQFKGTGTVNGVSGYGFLLTATDGQVAGGGGADKFRIKIWETATGTVVYDNAMGASEDIDAANPQVISGGSIVIHTKK